MKNVVTEVDHHFRLHTKFHITVSITVYKERQFSRLALADNCSQNVLLT